ncbi:DUF3102 domain-containing protein [Desulfosporosinus hippei]
MNRRHLTEAKSMVNHGEWGKWVLYIKLHLYLTNIVFGLGKHIITKE